MSAAKIGRYSLRPVMERDRDLLAVWIEQDPDHRDRVDPDFFMRSDQGKECFAVEDDHGHVVFYIKMTRALRLDVQFGSDEMIADRERNADAMREGFEWLRTGAAGSGIWEILFDSTNEPLVRFAERRLAFRKVPDELSYKVAPPPAYRPGKNT
jgi:hypothetical protein